MMPSADRGADVQASRYILQQFCTSNSTRQGRDRLAAREPWKTGHASACICARHNHVGKCSTHPRLHLSELPIAAFQRGTYMHVWHHVRRPYLAFSAGGASHGAFAPQMQTQALADAMAVADDSRHSHTTPITHPGPAPLDNGTDGQWPVDTPSQTPILQPPGYCNVTIRNHTTCRQTSPTHSLSTHKSQACGPGSQRLLQLPATPVHRYSRTMAELAVVLESNTVLAVRESAPWPRSVGEDVSAQQRNWRASQPPPPPLKGIRAITAAHSLRPPNPILENHLHFTYNHIYTAHSTAQRLFPWPLF